MVSTCFNDGHAICSPLIPSLTPSLCFRWEGELPENMSPTKTHAEFLKWLERGQLSGSLCVAKFFTEDCFSCRTLDQKFRKIAQENPDILFAKINGSNQDLVPLFTELNVTRVPWLIFFRDGKIVSEFSISLNPEKLAQLRAELSSQKRAVQMSR
jgi:thioredoxin-like negative regulator of GroEL